MKKHTINISKYEFHDGSLFKIVHEDTNIELTDVYPHHSP